MFEHLRESIRLMQKQLRDRRTPPSTSPLEEVVASPEIVPSQPGNLLPEQLDLLTKYSKAVLTLAEFGSLWSKNEGGNYYALGSGYGPLVTMLNHIKFIYWPEGYEIQQIPKIGEYVPSPDDDGSGRSATTVWQEKVVPDHSEIYMDRLTKSEQPIVFFLPTDISKTRYTKREIEWLLSHPDRMKSVIFVTDLDQAFKTFCQANEDRFWRVVEHSHQKFPLLIEAFVKEFFYQNKVEPKQE